MTAPPLLGFFRHHGLMAPGMLLFRNIGLAAKAAWVTAAFGIPLAVLAVLLWRVSPEAAWLAFGVAGLGLALGIYLLAAFARVTRGGIAEVGRQLRELASGNLTQRARPRGGDEIAQLMITLGDTVAALRNTVGQVRDGAAQIQAASQAVAVASEDLSQRTEQSAAHLQRTSQAMAEIGTTVRRTADSAAGASELVGRNADVAQRGGQVMGQAVGTMDGIRASSSRIAEIVGTIDDLAFQTNILALNAAVEAARAGGAGRGFAVVAAEVRALAQRSAASAREIRGLITASVEQVEGGAGVVGEAGETMTSIVAGAERVKSLIGEISAGAQGQTAGLEDIGRSVEQLDEMTRQNAALVQQTAASAATLRENAERLAREMAFFRVG